MSKLSRMRWSVVLALVLGSIGLTWVALEAADPTPTPVFRIFVGEATEVPRIIVDGATPDPPAVWTFATPTGIAALSETHATYTLTVIATNDTWGYLDPCG